jgi:hypothetical protein
MQRVDLGPRGAVDHDRVDIALPKRLEGLLRLREPGAKLLYFFPALLALP